MQTNLGEKMQLFVIEYEPGARGCPTLLKGEINMDWQWDDFEPDPDKFAINGNYVYRWKSPVIDFDFWEHTMIASEAFANLCDEFGARTRRVPLQIIQSNNQPTKKKYFYLLWKDWLSIIDFERSEYEIDRDLESGVPIRDPHFPEVTHCEVITKFIPDLSKVNDKHVFRCIDIGRKVVCDELFKRACVDKEFLGLKFVPIEDFQMIPFWKES
jgi:hypothetical protein